MADAQMETDSEERGAPDPDAGTGTEDNLRLPFAFARRHRVAIVPALPGEGIDNPCIIYVEPVGLALLAEVRRPSHHRKLPMMAVDSDRFDALLGVTYQEGSEAARQMMEGLGDELDLASLANSVPETEDLLEQEDDAPIIRLINALLSQGVRENASDIHIETYEKELIVRMRVDGVLREVVRPKRALAAMLVSRIKVMAKLDIAEKRIPQDGRIPLRLAGREVDVRVSTMPSAIGERVVMRLLDKQAGRLDLNRLGMADTELNMFRGLLARPHGVILVTGPTGSGKTTTLYAGLGEVDRATLNVLTVEDPIEYNLDGIGQTQVNLKADMTFARGLRAILRQDPDVVMVGEIRDTETAEIAMRASLTGHLVLSTIHTNTAIGAVTRLRDMGVESFLLSSSLIGVAAQRLVRTLCTDCRQGAPAADFECDLLRVDRSDKPEIYAAAGCAACGGTGYRGRTGIYEVVPVDDAIREMIHDGASEAEMVRQARRISGSITDDGRSKVLAGETTLDELMRITEES